MAGSVARQIVAIGGGGFSEDGARSPIDAYILGLTGVARPGVCFFGTASGDGDAYIRKFYAAFPPERAEASHVALFHGPSFDPNPDSLVNLGPRLREHLLSRHVIYVGGGNTVAMVAVWRAHGIDALLREAWEAGVILCGLSAGSLCWFASGTTDARGDGLGPFHDGLGFIPGSHSPHYSTEPDRRPTYHQLIGDGTLPGGLALDDDAAAYFRGDELVEVVASRDGARAYRVERSAGRVAETPIATRLLGRPA